MNVASNDRNIKIIDRDKTEGTKAKEQTKSGRKRARKWAKDDPSWMSALGDPDPIWQTIPVTYVVNGATFIRTSESLLMEELIKEKTRDGPYANPTFPLSWNANYTRNKMIDSYNYTIMFYNWILLYLLFV